MEPLRVGLVGAGPWARAVHAPGLAAHPRVELAGVWARRSTACADLAAASGTRPYGAVAALIDDVDAVAFAVPPDVQAELATSAARAGRHLILDKPIAGSLAGADELVAAVGEAAVASLVMLTLRFSPETREWLAELASGRTTGGWSGGTATWLSGALLGGDYAASAWRHRSGALVDVGPHAFDVLDAALGPIVDVVAATRREPDLWTVMLAHEGEAVSTATLSLRVPATPSIVAVDVYGSAGHRQLQPRRTTPQECYATLLDELVEMIDSGARDHPCDVRRGRHLQWVIDEAGALTG